MGNQKLIAGAVMVLLNLVLLSPIATSMVEVAVEEEFETYPYDSACANADNKSKITKDESQHLKNRCTSFIFWLLPFRLTVN